MFHILFFISNNFCSRLQTSMDFQTENQYWNSEFRGACESGDLQLAQLMIEKGANDLNHGLYYACRGAHLQLVEFLIKNGANNFLDEGLCGACRGGHLHFVQLMIEKGAKDLNYAFDCACRSGHLQIVKFLINLGVNDNWNAVLYCAHQSGHLEIIQLMIEKGATIFEYLSIKQVYSLLEIGTHLGYFEIFPKFKELTQDINVFRGTICNFSSHCLLIPDLLHLVSQYSLL